MDIITSILAVFAIAVLSCRKSSCSNSIDFVLSNSTSLTKNASALGPNKNSERNGTIQMHLSTVQPKTTFIPLSASCFQNESLQHDKTISSNSTCHSQSDAHACFQDPVHCKKHFPSNERTSNPRYMPMFGEYKYLSHEKWFRVIKEGGVAFLYHPCSSEDEIKKLRNVAHFCLRRYILTPSGMLHRDMPFALVSYGCFHQAAFVNATSMRAWLRNRTYTTLASPVYGEYKKHLVRKSRIVTDAVDSVVCPTKEELVKFRTPTIPITQKMSHAKIGEKIINERVQAIRYKVGDNARDSNFTSTKVHAGNATWAASSLFFICGILIGWLVYTKFYSKKNGERIDSETRFDYSHVYDEQDLYGTASIGGRCGGSVNRDYSAGFSLLKSSQNFINIFKGKKQERKLDSLSTVNLMVPISEDDEDEEDDFVVD